MRDTFPAYLATSLDDLFKAVLAYGHTKLRPEFMASPFIAICEIKGPPQKRGFSLVESQKGKR